MTAHTGNKPGAARLAVVGLVVFCARAYAGNGCDIGPEVAVTVIVDMDAQTPGIQSNVTVPAGTTVINDVAVYVFDPAQQSCVWGIGYLGGIDRGIAFGHMPDAGNQGEVVGMTADLGTHTDSCSEGQRWSRAEVKREMSDGDSEWAADRRIRCSTSAGMSKWEAACPSS